MSLALLEGREQLWQQRERSHLLSDTVTGIFVANPALNFYFFNETLSPLSLSTLPKKHYSNFDFFMDAHIFEIYICITILGKSEVSVVVN